MEVSVSQQLYVFIFMTLCGACSGLVFDLFRSARGLFPRKTLTTSLSDILFWLFISIGMFLSLFYISDGELRWHEVIGVTLGAIIYFLALSKFFMLIIGIIFRIFSKIIISIFKIILTPLVFLYKMIKKLLCFFSRKIGVKFAKFGNFLLLVKRSFKKLKLVMRKS